MSPYVKTPVLESFFNKVPDRAREASNLIRNRQNFTKFTGEHLCQSLFFNKAAGLRTTTLLKKSSGVTGTKSRQVRLKDFWAHTLA